MKKLKAPELKIPAVLVDLYWDLRDRRLLPVIALALLAIVAVPFLLGSSSKQQPSPALEALAEGASPVTSEAASRTLDVVEAHPGLRAYRIRLARRTPRNPFVQKFTAPTNTGGELNPETETSTGTKTTTTTTSSGTPSVEGPHEGGPPPPSEAPTGGKPPVTFFTFAIKARITRSGGNGNAAKVKEPPIVRDRVLPQTALPGDKTPVVTYMGLARSTTKLKRARVLLLVSTDVKSVFGETKCISGEEQCQLIEVEPGFPVTFVYGPNEVHYTVNVLKVEPVVTGHA